MSRKIHLEQLVGRVVRDADGRKVGRIYEMRAEAQGHDLVIVEYHLGSSALLERVGVSLSKLLGLRHRVEPRTISWDRLDLSDPEHPVLR